MFIYKNPWEKVLESVYQLLGDFINLETDNYRNYFIFVNNCDEILENIINKVEENINK